MKHEFEKYTVSIYEPFADYLLGSTEEKYFEISLLDVVRFAGHACPSMIGAFLISRRVIQEFYPETNVAVRGEIHVLLPSAATAGASGPISNVFGFIFGAWSETGFGGLKGLFARRHLLEFSAPDLPPGTFRFRHLPTNRLIDVKYNPEHVPFEALPGETFQQQWRRKVNALLQNPDAVIAVSVMIS